MILQILKKILPKFEIYSSVISYIQVLVFKDTSLLSGQHIETSISVDPSEPYVLTPFSVATRYG